MFNATAPSLVWLNLQWKLHENHVSNECLSVKKKLMFLGFDHFTPGVWIHMWIHSHTSHETHVTVNVKSHTTYSMHTVHTVLCTLCFWLVIVWYYAKILGLGSSIVGILSSVASSSVKFQCEIPLWNSSVKFHCESLCSIILCNYNLQ